MNSVILSGRITKDPEIKYKPSNKAYCQFSIAVKNDYRNANGEYECQFVECSGFGSVADYLSRYVHKGDLLLVRGKIQVQNYQAKDGTQRTSTTINVESLENVQPRNNNIVNTEQPQNQPQPQPKPKEQPKQVEQPNSFGLDDDPADAALPWL